MLLVIQLFLTTEMHQVFKFPTLVEHFREHRALSRDFSFMDFLDYHYAATEHSETGEEHHNLPFQAGENCPFLVSAGYTPMLSIISICPPKVLPAEISFALKDNWGYTSPLVNIWQPPRHS